eukprot:12830139-Alexandrium_andersonii.AAC.1
MPHEGLRRHRELSRDVAHPTQLTSSQWQRRLRRVDTAGRPWCVPTLDMVNKVRRRILSLPPDQQE